MNNTATKKHSVYGELTHEEFRIRSQLSTKRYQAETIEHKLGFDDMVGNDKLGTAKVTLEDLEHMAKEMKKEANEMLKYAREGLKLLPKKITSVVNMKVRDFHKVTTAIHSSRLYMGWLKGSAEQAKLTTLQTSLFEITKPYHDAKKEMHKAQEIYRDYNDGLAQKYGNKELANRF